MSGRALLTTLMMFTLLNVFSQDLRKNIDLKNNWLQLNEEKWIPLHWRDSLSVKVAGVELPVDAHGYFVFYNDEITDLYVNNNFYDRIKASGKTVVPIEEIKKLAHSRHVFITLFAEKGSLSLSNTYIGVEAPKKQLTGNSLYILIPRSFNKAHDKVLIIFYILVFLLVLAKVKHPRIFQTYFNWSNMIRNIPPEENVIASVLNKPSIYFVVLMSAIIGLEMTVFQLTIESDGYMFSDEVVVRVLAYFFLVFLVVVLKYYFLKYFGVLVGATAFYKRHYFEYLRIVFSIAIFLLIPLLVVYLKGQSFPFGLKIFFLISCLLGVLRLLLITTRHIKFSFLYLFSYICTSEIVPILIVTKFLF